MMMEEKMQKYSEKEVLQLMQNREEVNFYADAITPLHALGIEAAMQHLTQKGIKLIGYIALMAHDVTGYALNESDFHIVKNMDVEIVQIERIYEQRSVTQKIRHRLDLYKFYGNCAKKDITNKTVFYYITPFKPSFDIVMEISKIMTECRLQIIVTDEGLGSYLEGPYRITKSISIELGFKRTVKFIWELLIEARWFWNRLTKAGMTSEFLLLYKNAGRWEKNKACIEAYRSILLQNQCTDDFSYYEDAVLISPSLLYEAKILKEHADINIYKEISRFLNRKGIRIVAKPHPREKNLEWYGEINCILEKQGNAALESILAHMDKLPRCIVGDASTTLVTASILYGIKSISINKLIDKKHLRDKHYFDNFNCTFQNLVYMPETMEELMELI